MAYFQFTIRSPDKIKEALIHRLSELGCLGVVEQEDGIVAYFPAGADRNAITRELGLLHAIMEKAEPGQGLAYDYTLIPDADWNESWKKGFTPLDVGERFTILPPWEEKRSGRVNLIIDPGMAFGTGHHETTRSCLVLMEKNAGRTPKNRFLDLGTGTGLLAIAAAKFGYASVLAVDTDPLSIDAVKKNCALNSVTTVDVREGDISVAEGTFDVIAANLFSGLLIQLAPDIASRLDLSGMAILSGMLLDQADEVIASMDKAGLHLIEKLVDGKWASLVVEPE